MRKAICAMVLALSLSLAPVAAAQSIPIAATRHAIDHWWKGRTIPRIPRCWRDRYGDLCHVNTPVLAPGVTGWDKKLVWVSVTRDRLKIVDLGDELDLTISLILNPPSS